MNRLPIPRRGQVLTGARDILPAVSRTESRGSMEHAGRVQDIVNSKKPAAPAHPGSVDAAQEMSDISEAAFAAKIKSALMMHKQGQLDQAESIYKALLQSRPRHFDVLQLLATIAAQRKNHASAVKLFDEALQINPDHANTLNNHGNALRALGFHEASLKSFDRAIGVSPDYAEAHNSRGNALRTMMRNDEALESYGHALRVNPDFVEAIFNRGVVQLDLKRYNDALQSYDRVLKINPHHASALNNRGNALRGMGRHQEALASYDRGLEIRPDYANAHGNRGVALRDLKRHDEALDSFERALKIEPDSVDVRFNCSVTLLELRRAREAMDSFGRVLELAPDHVQALNYRAVALLDMARPEAALDDVERALGLDPDYPEALRNRGDILLKLKRPEAALASYERALQLKPDCEFLFGTLLATRMMVCDWRDTAHQISMLAEKLRRNEACSPPFTVLTITDDLPLQRKAAEIWVQEKFPADHGLHRIPKHPPHGRIRIGYFSADFRNHPVTALAAGLFETHDRSRFDLTAFSLGPDAHDDLRQRVEAAFEKFIDVRHKSDREVAALARNLEIDIAVDLGGFSGHARSGVFALRAAPVQVSYLGYLGTMGAEYIDYLFADETIIPVRSQEFYAEKIAYLPSYQSNDTTRNIAEKEFSREALGLPETGFVFCCFNHNYKITPRTFDGWMRILTCVPDSVLFLYVDNESAGSSLRREAEFRGVDSARLVFGKRLPVPEYLARFRAADLFLDTLPYNAGTTASDALWSGLPVLTCTGESFASRIAASVLNAIQLPELITSTPAEYEALAIELATNPPKLTQIKRKLAMQRQTAPLFNTPLFTRHMEIAYTTMYERYQANLPPAHIRIAP